MSRVIRPHARPRDVRDTFIAVIALFLFATTVLLLGYVPLRLGLEPVHAATGALAIAGLVIVGLALRTVAALELDDTGIRFRRFAGRPRFLSWDNITGVRRADRAEVVLRGWLLPAIPPRAFARSLTSVGHYRFDWARGSVYFPPADEDALLAEIERHWGGVLGSISPGSPAGGSRPG